MDEYIKQYRTTCCNVEVYCDLLCSFKCSRCNRDISVELNLYVQYIENKKKKTN
jgi:hypothetical protein